MLDFVLFGIVCVLVVLWLLIAVYVFNLVVFRKQIVPSKEELSQLLRTESELIRNFSDDQSRGLRQELSTHLQRAQSSMTDAISMMSEHVLARIRDFGEQLEPAIKSVERNVGAVATKLHADVSRIRQDSLDTRDALRTMLESKLTSAATKQEQQTRLLRDDMGDGFERLDRSLGYTLNDFGQQQIDRLDRTSDALIQLSEKQERAFDGLKQMVESKLDAIRLEGARKLDEMRQTVNEKLQSTLETRLGESFNRVVEQLNRVHEGLGEMRSLASNVGDLKNVLTNVKIRGTFGEVQLEMILEQFLTPDQYVKNVRVNPISLEQVEIAIRLPGKAAGEDVLLPVDAKFPREIYDRLLEASDLGDDDLVKTLRGQLEGQVRAFARDIRTKYINPPVTTEFALLFLPTEGLYAEALRQPGLFEGLQRDFKVTLAGPTTLAAILNALQMGFRSLAIEKRSGEVWQILGAVQAEFRKYNEVVEKLAAQLSTAAKSVETLGIRTRLMNQRLKSVEALPAETSASAILGIEDEALPADRVRPQSGP